MSKTKKMALLLLNAAEMGLFYLTYKGLKAEAKRAYAKGRMDVLDDFVKGVVFCNSKTITVESEHNGSVELQIVKQ